MSDDDTITAEEDLDKEETVVFDGNGTEKIDYIERSWDSVKNTIVEEAKSCNEYTSIGRGME